MLVLSRRENESIIINEDIVITVVAIRGDKVRIGIAASKDVPVHRKEVFEAIKEERMRAAVAAAKLQMRAVSDEVYEAIEEREREAAAEKSQQQTKSTGTTPTSPPLE